MVSENDEIFDISFSRNSFRSLFLFIVKNTNQLELTILNLFEQIVSVI